MKIFSPAFTNGGPIPKKYTCDGDPKNGGINPPLEISYVPEQAQSLVLILEDPDAPGGTWIHWVLWNFSPGVTSIPENSVPQGAVLGKTSSGNNFYEGPCPPSGTHHYYFRLYALPTILNLSSFADTSAVHKEIDGITIAEAEWMGTYSKTINN
jgi:Raf kinase inhibitor-like YbhB/YbcL family protein